MKRAVPIILFAFLSVICSNFISIAANNKNAPPPCKSCLKAADSGKKQSATGKMCSKIINILDNEIGKTKNKTKLDVLKGGLKYANDICDRGGTPDLAKITKGLPEKDKLRISQKTNSALFDGADPDLPAKDFGPNISKTAATLTGAGGQIADLKTSEPNIPKLNLATEFSLARPSTLLASAKTAVAATAGDAGDVPCSIPGEPRVECCCGNDKKNCWKDPKHPKGWMCYGVCLELTTTPGNCGWGFEFEWLDNLVEKVNKLAKGALIAAKNVVLNAKNAVVKTGKDILAAVTSTAKGYWEDIKTIKEKVDDWYHEKIGDKKCGTDYFDPDDECCSGGGVFSKQACTAGAIGITGPSDLILYKPAANSKFITLRATAGCCPAKFKWSSSSSDKIKFLGATDQAAVVVKPLAASATKDDISVFVAIDGVTSPPKKLTVRRPNKMTRPDKLECIVRKETFRATYVVGTPDQFKWTLTDQLGDPMVGIKVTEIVTFDSTYGNITLAETRFPKSGQKEPITETTDKAGQMEDQYIIPIGDRKAHVSVHVIQVLKLIEEGYEGTAQIYLSETDVTGTNPVKFK